MGSVVEWEILLLNYTFFSLTSYTFVLRTEDPYAATLGIALRSHQDALA